MAGKTQIGTRTITKKMFGTREITKEVVNGVVVYEKQASIISFTIAGITCQADDGMTWEEWVNSSYNTPSFVVWGGGIWNNGLSKSVNLQNHRSVSADEEIISNYSYLLEAGGN